MEYLLPAAFFIGLLLFVLSWLRVIIAGFGHHFVTGFVSAIPVINLLVLPSIWHKVYAWVLAGIIGLLVAIGSWFAGADKHVYRYASDAGVSVPSTGNNVQTEGLDLQNHQQTITRSEPETGSTPLSSGTELPRTALYKMSYQEIKPESLGRYLGQYVRITRNDRKTFEGKILGTTDKAVIVERRTYGGIIEQPVNLVDIISAEIMSKQ